MCENIFGWKFNKQKPLPVEYYRIETKDMNGGLLKRYFMDQDNNVFGIFEVDKNAM